MTEPVTFPTPDPWSRTATKVTHFAIYRARTWRERWFSWPWRPWDRSMKLVANGEVEP